MMLLRGGKGGTAAGKLEKCREAGGGLGNRLGRAFERKGALDQQLQKIGRDCNRMAIEQAKGISSQVGRPAHICLRICGQRIRIFD